MKITPTPGEVIRHLRIFKNLKQYVVAKKMGIRQQSVSKLERAKKIGAQKVAQLLVAMGSSAAELEKIKGLGNPPPPKFRLTLAGAC